MSKEEIPWDKVAKEIIKVLGAETARGLYYGFTVNTLYPLLSEAIRKAVSKGASEEELRRIIQEELARANVQLPATAQQPSPEELERRIAQMLRQAYYSQAQATYPPPSYPPSQAPLYPPTPQPPPALRPPERDTEMLEVESLKERLQTLERTRNELTSRYYTTMDDAEREKIKKRLDELDLEIRDIKARLERLIQVVR